MNPTQRDAMDRVLAEVRIERDRQHAEHGEQNLRHGLRFEERALLRGLLARCRRAQEGGARRWSDVLLEEVCEAVLATDPDERGAELIQVEAVANQWVEALDRAAQAKQAGAGAMNAPNEGQGKGVDGIVQQEGAGCVHFQTGFVANGYAHCFDCGENVRRDADLPGFDANGSEVE